ncbi:PREDICTED: PH domain leucine-rich repeat protein phosphatase 1-like, partial [Priapulus caudatus]|uniref:PH domain leucine-rich repeat protein phosphatase 1-like n=1 Tax=Priapulus caudatus TaxID=37621 RepID=A0ABM1ER60_PRICU
MQGGRCICLSFSSDSDLTKWLRKCTKAAAKLPNLADLSNNHLEYIPENLFVNDRLSQLNLRHNALKERPIEEDIYTIGWVDDLPSFQNLHSLNLSDNDLYVFPSAICQVLTLQELNVSSNMMADLPPIIAELINLRVLHLHNNLLSSLPSEMSTMRQLYILILAFNRFTCIPEVLVSMPQVENVVMAGNYIDRLPGDTVSGLKHIKQMDLRLNSLTLPPVVTMTFELLEHLTHLDVCHNNATNLDLRALPSLEYLRCCHNQLVLLQASGTSLKQLHARHNSLQSIYVTPLPENLRILDVAHNELGKLPDWVCDLWRLEKLNASHNRLTLLPNRLLSNMESLRHLYVDHNQLSALPDWVENCAVETLHVEYNRLEELPDNLLINCPKLCITQVRLQQYGSDEGLFAMCDGGRNNEAPLLLQEKLPAIMRDEMNHPLTSERYLKYTLLTAHRKLKASGQRLGASAALCHIRAAAADDVDSYGDYSLGVANVGSCEVVLCRQGEALRLSRLFTVAGDEPE